MGISEHVAGRVEFERGQQIRSGGDQARVCVLFAPVRASGQSDDVFSGSNNSRKLLIAQTSRNGPGAGSVLAHENHRDAMPHPNSLRKDARSQSPALIASGDLPLPWKAYVSHS